MDGNTLEGRINKKNIWAKLPLEDKVRENRLRWFYHVQRRPIDTIVKIIVCLVVMGTLSVRGRHKKNLDRNS